MNTVVMLVVAILLHCAHTTGAKTADKKCPEQFCRNGGTCKWMDNGFECDCIETFTGKHCDIPVPCPADHCQNGGSCESTSDGFICHCTDDYTGSLCEVPPKPATSCNSEYVCESGGMFPGQAVIPVIPPEQCSFPFTYNYTQYYSCAENIEGVTDSSCAPLGCFTANRTAARCCLPGDYTAEPVAYDVPAAGDQPSISTQSIDEWIVIMSKPAQQGHWNRTWVEFRDGFGTVDTDFWLGLERMHALTSSNNYQLRLELSANGQHASAEWWSFAVGDEASFYTLKVDGFARTNSFRLIH